MLQPVFGVLEMEQVQLLSQDAEIHFTVVELESLAHWSLRREVPIVHHHGLGQVVGFVNDDQDFLETRCVLHRARAFAEHVEAEAQIACLAPLRLGLAERFFNGLTEHELFG